MDAAGASPGHYSAEAYLRLEECGVLAPDDRVELLDGLVVAMPPPTPPHDDAVHRVQYALLRRLGLGVMVRVQSTFLAGSSSVLEPDVAVLPGGAGSYASHHPSQAWLVVEVALSSLPQDRLTKAAIYARAGVPCYWIVNLREGCVEAHRDPDRFRDEYRSVVRAAGDDVLTIDEFPEVSFRAGDFLPPPTGPGTDDDHDAPSTVE